MNMNRMGAFVVACAFVLPSPAQAMSRAEMAQTFQDIVCTVRAIIGSPCVFTFPVSFSVNEQAQTSMAANSVVTTTVVPEASIPVVREEAVLSAPIYTAHEAIDMPPVDQVRRGEFVAAMDSLGEKVEAVLTKTNELSVPVVQRVVSAQVSTPVFTTPSSLGRSYDAEIASLWQALSLTNRIDKLSGATITDSTFSGTFNGTFTGTLLTNALSASTLSLTGGFSGTSITANTLTITGTSTAATTTSAILDTRGQVCNVQAYGAVGNNSTDNYTAIMAAIQACPAGGIVFFPPGTYRIGQTLVLDAPVSIQGTYAPRWTYSAAPQTSIKPTPTFSGSHIIHVRDKTISGQASDNNGGRISNITIDGNSYGSGINGIYFEGLVRDWKLSNVDITQTSGDGFEAAQGTGSGNPRGFTIEHLAIYSPASHGFRATALNDSYIEDVLVVGGAQRGFYLSSMGETKLSNSRAVFNALEGLYIDGSSSNGGFQVSNFSTDRNDRHGVRISATGTTTITFDNLLTRRDGPNVGLGSETPYAGVAIIGTVGAQVAPVVIRGLSQIPGKDDSNSGPSAPATGVRAEYASYVSVDGVLWGVTNPYTDDGNNNYFFIGEESLLKTGFTTVTTTIYNKKWMIATSTTGLVYTAGSVGIGTTSPTAQLHTTGTVRFSGIGAGSLQTDANGNVTVSSDERLKDVQGAYDIGLDAILTLRPITYHWNNESGLDTQTLYAGFSAQNVKEAIPAAVGEDPRGYLTLSDRPILAAVVNALHTVWETVTGNTQKIADLEARVRVLEAAAGVYAPPVLPTENSTATTTPINTMSETSTATSSPTEEPGPVSE
ncbi:MAG: hypothetical protein RLZZ342_136 [Candidatus Parcubacteria bacterium]|jgi:hypothetical protein